MQHRLSADSVGELSGDYTDTEIGIWITFSEIYNEHVHDLLQTQFTNNCTFGAKQTSARPKLPLGLDKHGKTYVKNLSSVCVTSGLEAYKVLQYGMHNLNYASTEINRHSSRSHCIFTIKLVQSNKMKGEVQVSHFSFCDLAGSERVKNSHSVGERIKESSNINNSLHVLGRCIKAIRSSQKTKDNRLIPYRESKLTRLFQPALSGKETITMIVNINPDKMLFDENLHVLNFSSIAKDVTVENNIKPVKIALKHRLSETMEIKTSSILYSEDRGYLEEEVRRKLFKKNYLQNYKSLKFIVRC